MCYIFILIFIVGSLNNQTLHVQLATAILNQAPRCFRDRDRVGCEASLKNAFGNCIKLLIRICTAVSIAFVVDQTMCHRANRMVKFVNNSGHVRIQFLQFGVLTERRTARGLVHEGRLLVAEALSALDQALACQSGKHILGHFVCAKESAVLEQDSH